MVQNSSGRKRFGLTQQIWVGLGLGIIIGVVMHELIARGTLPKDAAEHIKPFSDLLLRFIKMIVAPLIFATLVSGIAGAGKSKGLGRTGLRAMIYFEVVTTFALVVGLLVANIWKPGEGVQIPLGQITEVPTTPHQHWYDFVLHAVPTSVVKAMAEGEVLQLVVFSVLFAIALTLVGEKGKPIVVLTDALATAMFKLTHILMQYAPIGVCAAIAYVIASSGFGVIGKLAALVGSLYLALAILTVTVLLPSALMFRVPIKRFLQAVKDPAVLAFTTSSSEAALPVAMENMEAMGVPKPTVGLVLPLGYSFNLTGSTLYLTLGTMFVAQAVGRDMSLGEQIQMVLMLMLTSKGVAGVSRASLVIMAGTLATFNLPIEGITLILGVDAIMDMGRSLMNVTGNCLATVIVSRWDGTFELKDTAAADTTALQPISSGVESSV